MSEYTKTPWVQDKFGSLVGQDGKTVIVWGLGIAHGLRSEETEANAHHIVHCVNNHERLVSALEATTEELESLNVGLPHIKGARAILQELEDEL